MRGDFSRDTFRADKHYSSVLMQQGRVGLDADWNEQQAILRHRSEAEARDLIGPTGAPRVNPGFAIGVAGADLSIGPGHYYVDGILCENDAEGVLVSSQPDLLPLGAPLLPADPGLYLVYLQVWRRHLTAVEDSAIREPALGGPDTATRLKTVWQARLLRVTDPGGAVSCATSFAEWDDLLAANLVGVTNAGQLSAQPAPETPTPDPLCILPPGAGYRRLENQLYRVEVHTGGPRATARFKWSRDNGTVVSAIEPDPESGAVLRGNSIVVADIGRDDVLSFASDPLPEWVELSDDRHELMGQRGLLVRVQSVDRATRTITLDTAGLPADVLAGLSTLLDAEHNPTVRRWDQSLTGATHEGVAMTGAFQELESGVQVRFGDGAYRAGDYWLIPARTAIGLEQGSLEWPRDAGGPLPQPPHSPRHHFARLALVRRTTTGFSLVADGDCRQVFPPLTAITAEDVSFDNSACALEGAETVQEALDQLCRRNSSMCTLLLSPGDDLAAAVASIAGAAGALICFRAGTYTLGAPLRLAGFTRLALRGCGPATRIVAAQGELALLVEGCASASVSDLHVEGQVAEVAADRGGDLFGALTFERCGEVLVERVSARCAGGPERAASCITVRALQPGGQPSESARIRSCDLEVGHQQIGLLLVNARRAQVEDNRVRAGARPPADLLLRTPSYRGLLRRQLISALQPTPPTGGVPPGTNASVTFGDFTIHFRTEPSLVRGGRLANEWQRAINDAFRPGRILSPQDLGRHLTRLAGRILQARGVLVGLSPLFRTAVERLLDQDTPVAGQGIVVGGQVAEDVRILGNSVQGAIQGIHVGLSQQAGAGAPPLSARTVLVRDNTVEVSLPASATRERHGIFVGNCQSLIVEGNHLRVTRAAGNAGLRVEAIRLFGLLGLRAVVRHNHIESGYTIGIVFAPLNSTVPPRPLWVVTENVAESAAQVVQIPARAPGVPGVPQPGQVQQRILGFANNFA